MTTFKTILAATDFSIDGNNAVRRAAMLARQHGARLTILHVIDEAALRPVREWFLPSLDNTTRIAQAHVTLQRLAREQFDRHEESPTLDVLIGDTIAVLSRAGRRADLLVLGQRARSPLKDLLMGHTAHRLAARSRRPILVVKQAVQGPYQSTLVPFNFTPVSDAAAVLAAAVARDADLQFFHAVKQGRDHAADENREMRTLESEGLVARMRRRVSQLGLDSRKMWFEIGHGPSALTILNRQQTLRADLMVTGKQRRWRLSDALSSSVSLALLKQASCDTLIVPHRLFDPQPSRGQAALRPTGPHANVDIGRLPGSTAAFARPPDRSWLHAAPAQTRPLGNPRCVVGK